MNLERYFNDAGVRIFVLTGAPEIPLNIRLVAQAIFRPAQLSSSLGNNKASVCSIRSGFFGVHRNDGLDGRGELLALIAEQSAGFLSSSLEVATHGESHEVRNHQALGCRQHSQNQCLSGRPILGVAKTDRRPSQRAVGQIGGADRPGAHARQPVLRNSHICTRIFSITACASGEP